MSEQLDTDVEEHPSDFAVLNNLLERREWSAELASLVIAGLDPVKNATYGVEGWERYLCFLPGGLQAGWKNYDGTVDRYYLAQHAIDEHTAVREFIRGAPRSPAEWLQIASDWNYTPHWKAFVADHSVFSRTDVKVSGAVQKAKDPARQAGGHQRFANSRAGKTHVVIEGKWHAAKELGVPVDRDKFIQSILDEHLLPGKDETSKKAARQRRELRATEKTIMRWVSKFS